MSGLPFRDGPTELAYVTITNEASDHPGSGGYSHHHDALVLVPEPATLSLLCIGGWAMIRRHTRHSERLGPGCRNP